MFDLIIGALLPVTIILLLGFIAGAHGDFNKDQAGVFNKMVMLYALPLCLFCGIIALPVQELIEQKDLVLGLFIGIVLMFWIVIAVLHFVFKMQLGTSALISLAVTCPSAAFIGTPILGTLFGQISSVSVALTSIFMNLFQVPFTIMFLLADKNKDSQQTGNSKNAALKNLFHAVQQPVVIAPVIALILAFLRIKFPEVLLSAFDLLGKATGGIALFASGIILFSYKIKITKEVLYMVLFRNIIIPFIVWGIIVFLDFPKDMIRETILTLAIPSATMALILSIEYDRNQQLIATSLFVSTIASLATMGLFIALLLH